MFTDELTSDGEDVAIEYETHRRQTTPGSRFKGWTGENHRQEEVFPNHLDGTTSAEVGEAPTSIVRGGNCHIVRQR